MLNPIFHTFSFRIKNHPHNSPGSVSFVLASGSHVYVWDAQTGKKRNEFFNIIPEGDITAASFDSRMRKLLLGTSKGDGEC